MFEERMEFLKTELVGYGKLVEKMIKASIEGLLKKNKDELREVIDEDEPRANQMELVLDELCTTIIAQYEPKAKNLRTVLMAAKMTNDLERMGDHAVNIAFCSLFLIEKPQVKALIDIPRMADEAVRMLKDSLIAYVEENAKLAKEVCERDPIVDGLRNQILRELITFMTSDPTTIERAIQLIKISQNLERVADLSTNICEDVIFMVEGKVIKHHKEDL